jgi:hypothetical protein
MKIVAPLIILLLTWISASGQNLIGYKEKDIRNYMKEKQADLNYNSVKNSKFKYLKYCDNSDTQTLLFFLNRDSVCNNIRIICNAGIKDEKTKEFDSLYEKNGENKWIEKRDGKNYSIEITDEKWSCIITIKQDK